VLIDILLNKFDSNFHDVDMMWEYTATLNAVLTWNQYREKKYKKKEIEQMLKGIAKEFQERSEKEKQERENGVQQQDQEDEDENVAAEVHALATKTLQLLLQQ